MTKLSLFLSQGGRSLWQIEESALSKEKIQEEYCIPNGIIPLRIQILKDIAFIEIDSEQTNLQDFYTWEEACKHIQRPECWRSFYFFKNGQTDWFTPVKGEGEIEGVSIQTYYEDILRHFTN